MFVMIADFLNYFINRGFFFLFFKKAGCSPSLGSPRIFYVYHTGL